MKLLVFADSHGRGIGMFAAVEREKPDAIIHLGDYTEDGLDLARSYRTTSVYCVRGNNDYDPQIPLSSVIKPAGVPIYLSHGHREHVSMLSCGVLPQKAAEAGCVLALFGHTHRMLLEKHGGVWVMNPGSISLPRGGPASFGRLTVDNGQLRRIEIFDEDGVLQCGECFNDDTKGEC